MVCIHPVISSEEMSFCIFFRLTWKIWFEVWPVYIYYMLSMLGLWCRLAGSCGSCGVGGGCGARASGICGPGSAISYLTLLLYCIVLYSILFNAYATSFDSVSFSHFVYWISSHYLISFSFITFMLCLIYILLINLTQCANFIISFSSHSLYLHWSP